jgi:hypothetical protein
MESAGFSIIFLVVSGFLKIERNLFDREFPIINKYNKCILDIHSFPSFIEALSSTSE